MKKYTYLSKVIFAFLALTMVCCEGVLVPDPIDPRLPKYSESGYNTAGAFINTDVWKSVVKIGFMQATDQPRITLYNSKDSLKLLFDGSSRVYDYIEFHLSGLNIHKFEDLMLLKDRKIQLDGLKNSAVCLPGRLYDDQVDDPNFQKPGGIGQLYIKNVTMNDSLNRATLSGTFGFTVTDSLSGINEVSYGRFDYRFGKDTNFGIE